METNKNTSRIVQQNPQMIVKLGLNVMMISDSG